MLALIWWMYGGYAWLTKPSRRIGQTARPGAALRHGGILPGALTIPTAFSRSGLAFGLAYLAIVVIHAGLLRGRRRRAWSRRSSGSFPLIFFQPSSCSSAARSAAASVRTVDGRRGHPVADASRARPERLRRRAGSLRRETRARVDRCHRRICCCGRARRSGLAVDAALALVALLGLTLSACLWWSTSAIGTTKAPSARSRPWSRSIVPGRRSPDSSTATSDAARDREIAAAEESALEHPFSSLEWSHAVLLGGGVFVYLIGDALFRHQLTLGTSSSRLVAAALALATIPIGAETSAATQIGTLVAILSASILVASRANAKRARR